jgi:molybdopterin/thiamine biosynthesis adenylyltransferase
MSAILTVKQDAFINSKALADYTVHVFGVGSIGSNLIKQLALVGIQNIVAYDFDTVAEDNIGSQEFDMTHIGMKKTEAIQKLMKERYDYDVEIQDGKIDDDTLLLGEDKHIYFCAFDSLKARKLVWDKLKKFPIIWGESRIGTSQQRFYFVDLITKDDAWIAEYESTLASDAPVVELKCGEKGCYPSNAELCAKIVRQVVNIAENKPVAKIMVSDWGYPADVFVSESREFEEEAKYD